MKKLAALILILTLVLLPQAAFAAEIPSSKLDLTAYLNEISTIRGFDVSEDDIVFYLYMNDKTLDEFKTVEELKIYLGEVIKADLSNLEGIYNIYGLDQTKLTELLEEYGEELDDYIFLDDLDTSIDFYTYDYDDVFEREADFDAKLTVYLAEVSAVRGFEVSIDDFNAILSEFSMSIEDWETVAELKDDLGEVIKADLSNLDYFEIDYDMDEDMLLEFLEETGKSIDDFIYMSQLEYYIMFSSEDADYETDTFDYMDGLDQFGLTEAELQNVQDHMLSLEQYLSSAEYKALIEDWNNRMMAFEDTMINNEIADDNYELSDEEITEYASLLDEYYALIKLKLVFSTIKDGVETPCTTADLIKMIMLTSQDEIPDVDYKISFYNDESVLLADYVITKDLLYTEHDDLDDVDNVDDVDDGDLKGINDVEVVGDVGDVIERVSNATLSDQDNNNDLIQTVKGGKLPKTATNYIPNALLGLFITVSGIMILQKTRTDKIEIL